MNAVVAKPDFTGVWKLVRGASEFGFLPPPRLRIDTIAQENGRLRIQTRQKDANGDVTVERDLEIGGEPVSVAIHGRNREVRAYFEDAALVIETRFEVSGHARRIEDRLSVDSEREWLTILRLIDQPGGAVRQCLRLRRQPHVS